MVQRGNKLKCDIIMSNQYTHKKENPFDIIPRTLSFNKCGSSNMVYDSLFMSLFILLVSAMNKI